MWDIKSIIKFGLAVIVAILFITAVTLPLLGQERQVLAGNHSTLTVSAYENNGFEQYRDIAIGGGGSFNIHPITSLPVTVGVSFDGYFPRFFNQQSRNVNNYEFIFGLPVKWLFWQQFQQEGLFISATPQLFYQDLSQAGNENKIHYGGTLSLQYQRAVSDKFSLIIEGGARAYDADGVLRTGLVFSTGVVLR